MASGSADSMGKKAIYDELKSQLAALLGPERDFIANTANTSSLLFHTLPDLNWVGCYIERNGDLVLGPFQGQPACVRIPVGKGVCGTAAQEMKTVMVGDVHTFPGHIACDNASKAEIVLPLIMNSRLCGVLDLDSPVLDRFDAGDRRGLEELVRTFVSRTDPPLDTDKPVKPL